MAFLFWLWCYIITKGDQCTNWYTTLYTIDSSSNFHCLLFATRNVQSFTFVHLPQNTLLCVCVGRLISLSEDAITIVSFDQVELTDPYQPGLWQPTCYWVCLFSEDILQLYHQWCYHFGIFLLRFSQISIQLTFNDSYTLIGIWILASLYAQIRGCMICSSSCMHF